MAYVLYVADTETTGTDAEKHDIIEVCFWRVGSLDNILTQDDNKTWWMKPLNVASIEDEALRVNKHKKEDILHKTAEGKEKYKHPSEVLPEIEMWFMQDGAAAEERVLVGHNPDFDYKFLLKLWEKSGNANEFPIGYWIDNSDGTRRHQIFKYDTMELVRLIDLCTGKKRNYYNLSSLVKAFNITKAQAHRADGDTKMTKDLFLKIIEVLKPVLSEKFSDCY
jgi:DNA polymerase III epsilon subunit-like protein